MNMQTITSCLVGAIALLSIPSCASGSWREGFSGSDRLYLVGEGHAREDLPQVQRIAMAREAALIDALSHWPRHCGAVTGDDGIATYRVENQKLRLFECEGTTCRARIVIERSGLREKCKS